MQVISAPLEFQRRCSELARGGDVGLVPTMGALHAGHLSLVRAARAANAATAVTIFVNPLQFGPHEDLDRYPRPLAADLEQLAAAGVDLVFTPEPAAMYPPGEATRVEVVGLGDRLCGASRPGHFRGVATVVLKLLELARPRRAYFGRKDAAQFALLRRLAIDLFLPVEMIVCPIVRDADGLALSSRNAYLSASQRQAALALSRSLAIVGEGYRAGERAAARLLDAGRAHLARAPLRLDYFEAVHALTLAPLTQAGPGALFAIAAFAGDTRLIDNAVIDAAGIFTL